MVGSRKPPVSRASSTTASSSGAIVKSSHRRQHPHPHHHHHELQDAFRMLRSAAADLMRNVFGHPLPPIPRHKPSVLLRAIRRLHSHKYNARVRATAHGVKGGGAATELNAVAVGLAYMKYVSATYGEGLPESVDGSEVLFGDYDGEQLWSPAFFVARDDEMKRFVVAVRGTKSLKDALTDLVADTVQFGSEGGLGHRGFVKASANVFDKVVQGGLKEMLRERDSYGLAVVGHSLGAAVTQLLVKMMIDDGGFGKALLGVAVAPPPVFAPAALIDDEWASAVHCFVHADDVVTRASMFTVRNLLVEAFHVDRVGKSKAELEAVGVDKLEVQVPGHGEPVFHETSRLRPGKASDCEECKELAEALQEREKHAQEHGAHPICERLAAVRRGPSGESRGDGGGGDAKLSTGSMDIDQDPSHQEADEAAHAHHRHLLRFKHHHEEDVKNIDQLVVVSRDIHWLIDARVHGQGHRDAEAAKQGNGTGDGKAGPNAAKRGEGIISKSLRKMRLTRSGSEKQKIATAEGEDNMAAAALGGAPALNVSSNSIGEDNLAHFVAFTLPPEAFQSVFLTPSCVDAHSVTHYAAALSSLVHCDECASHREEGLARLAT